MTKYIAIGHFKWNDNVRSVAFTARNKKAFREDMIGNEFVAWAVISEKEFEELKQLDWIGIYETAKKYIGSSNWRRLYLSRWTRWITRPCTLSLSVHLGVATIPSSVRMLQKAMNM